MAQFIAWLEFDGREFGVQFYACEHQEAVGLLKKHCAGVPVVRLARVKRHAEHVMFGRPKLTYVALQEKVSERAGIRS